MHLLANEKDLHFEWQAKTAARERASEESRVSSRALLHTISSRVQLFERWITLFAG